MKVGQLRIRVTLDGSLKWRSVTCRYHSMPRPLFVWIAIQCRGGGKNHPVGFSASVATHRRSLWNEELQAPSFLSFSPRRSRAFSPGFFFMYSLLLVLLSSFASGSEWFELGGFRGRRIAATELEGGNDDAPRGCPCNSVALCHCASSFIPDFAVDLRSEFTKTVTPRPPRTFSFPSFP